MRLDAEQIASSLPAPHVQVLVEEWTTHCRPQTKECLSQRTLLALWPQPELLSNASPGESCFPAQSQEQERPQKSPLNPHGNEGEFEARSR